LTFTFHPLPGWPCGADFYHFWLVVSYHRRNHPCEIFSRLVKGLGGYDSPKSGVSHWLWMSLLQQCYALTCYTVMAARRTPSQKIWKECISRMSYPIHFNETDSIFAGIWERLMREVDTI